MKIIFAFLFALAPLMSLAKDIPSTELKVKAIASFEKACQDVIKGHPDHTNVSGKNACNCISTRIAPKLSAREFDVLTAAYKNALSADQESDDSINLLLNFELTAASNCLQSNSSKTK